MVFSYFLRKLNEKLDYNKDDPLYFVRLLTVDLPKKKSFQIVLISCLSYNLGLLLIEIIYFSLNFKVQEFIQFFSLNVGALHGYMACWMCLQYETDIRKLYSFQETNFIKLSSVKKRTYERIHKSLILRRYLFLLDQILLLLLFLFFWPLFGYEDDYYFPVFFFNEYLKPVVGRHIVYALRTFFYMTTYSYLVSAAIQFDAILYFLSHMQFQLIIVEDNIRDIGSTCRTDDGEILQQSLVNENLKVCIRNYLCVKTCIDQMIGWIMWPMATTVVGSFLLLLSYVYFVIAQASLEAFPRVASLGLVSACTITIYAVCGQGLVDQCDNVNSSLYFSPWYEFDKKNRTLLRLFMVTSSQPLRLSMLGFLEIDSTLVMKVYKFVFSSLATIQQIVAIRKKDD